MSQRAIHVALALGTIVVGLFVNLHGDVLGPVARDVLGDALWATMIAWWVGALAPSARLVVRSVAAYAICVAVETSQLYHTPAVDAVRGTALGRLVLGSGFDPRDLAAYAAGVAVAAMLGSRLGAGRLRERPEPRKTSRGASTMTASWRECPFVEGQVYTITRDVTVLRDSFRAGERLTFVKDAFSAYHGMTGYFFKDASGGDRAFDVADDEPGDEWQSVFAPVES